MGPSENWDFGNGQRAQARAPAHAGPQPLRRPGRLPRRAPDVCRRGVLIRCGARGRGRTHCLWLWAVGAGRLRIRVRGVEGVFRA